MVQSGQAPGGCRLSCYKQLGPMFSQGLSCELWTKFRLWGGAIGDYIGFGGNLVRGILQI